MKKELELRFPESKILIDGEKVIFRNEIEYNLMDGTIDYIYKPFRILQLNRFVDGIKSAQKSVEIQDYYNEHMEEIEAMEWDDNNYTIEDKVVIYQNEL